MGHEDREIGKLSKVGGWLSILCAAHCMLSPVLLGLIPVIHADSPVVEQIETGLIVVSILIGVAAVAAGYREHRRRSIVALLVVALALLAAGRFMATEEWEVPFVVGGAMVMAVAQFRNFRLQRNCCAVGAARAAVG
jgi:MerC mercury resistance protein